MKIPRIHITRQRLLRLGRNFLITLVSLFGLFLLLNLIFPVPDKVSYSTLITNNKGEIIHAYLTPDQKWRLRTELDEISPLLQKTIVAKEDKYFYSHPGVNPFAIIRAVFNNITRGRRTSGASTITMQVAKALEPGKRNIWRKMRETFRAFQLEWKYSKKEILCMYLNLVPYGGNIEGVKAASLLYFNKNPDHLSLAEITALSIIPNKPGQLIPGKHNGQILEERNHWLKKFADEKVFTEKEIEDALNEPLLATRRSFPRYAPHLSDKLRKQGKEIIHTSIDLEMQMKTEKLVTDYVRVQRLQGIKNASVVIVDNETHEVITYVGSSGFYDTTDAGQVNGAAAVRQPGSTLKPLLYALCFDEGLLTPKTVVTDVSVNYEGYAPENYDSKFNGYVTIEYALGQSLNIPAVKSLRMLGHEKLINSLGGAGFRQIQKDRRKLGLSMILGGCGTTLEELTGLFSSFANNGNYVPLKFLGTEKTVPGKEIISPASAFMLTTILSDIHRPDFPVNWSATERMPRIAWKTGTSYGRRDGWSIGYNKKYTVGVWTGNFSGTGVPALSGAQVATPLLFRIFNTIDYDSDEAWFVQPESCDFRKVCSETGMVPADHCTSLVTDYFIPLISPTQVCNNRQEVMLSPDGKISYCRSCAPASGYKKKWFKTIEPAMQAWMTDNRINFEAIPPHNPSCEIVFKGAAPQISSPVNGTEYLVSKKNPEPLQLVARSGNDVTKLYWYINDQFYKSSLPGEKQFFLPPEGPVKISCTDDKGRNRNINITVKFVDL